MGPYKYSKTTGYGRFPDLIEFIGAFIHVHKTTIFLNWLCGSYKSGMTFLQNIENPIKIAILAVARLKPSPVYVEAGNIYEKHRIVFKIILTWIDF